MEKRGHNFRLVYSIYIGNNSSCQAEGDEFPWVHHEHDAGEKDHCSTLRFNPDGSFPELKGVPPDPGGGFSDSKRKHFKPEDQLNESGGPAHEKKGIITYPEASLLKQEGFEFESEGF